MTVYLLGVLTGLGLGVLCGMVQEIADADRERSTHGAAGDTVRFRAVSVYVYTLPGAELAGT